MEKVCRRSGEQEIVPRFSFLHEPQGGIRSPRALLGEAVLGSKWATLLRTTACQDYSSLEMALGNVEVVDT
jgi:hypothetical protein